MQKVLFGAAFLSHPVFVPFYSLLIYWPLLGKYNTLPLVLFGFWILFVHLVFPAFYLYKVKKIDFNKPLIEERQSIYKGYALLNLVLSIVSLIVIKEYFAFFISLALLNFFMYFLATLKLKASWHTSSWALLLVASLIEWYSLGLTIAPTATLILFLLTAFVFVIRLRQKAHTLFELSMGLACGASAAALLFFI